jgi:ketosteroid isomerase-like protein
MSNSVAERFVRTLRDAEQSRDPTRLAELFTDDAELSNLTQDEPRRGKAGARQFWAEYLHSFGKVRSQFGKVVEADGAAVLEWEAEASLRDGPPVRYRGVSILETAGDRVKRFRTYYDTAALRPAAVAANSAQAAPRPAADEWGPDAVRPTQAGGGAASVEQINRETLPRASDGQVVDPKQEEVRDTAG